MSNKIIKSFSFLISFLLISNWCYGQRYDVRLILTETIKIDPNSNLRVTPKSFCAGQNGCFFIPDCQSGTIKVLSKEVNSFIFITEIGRNGFGQERFGQPWYCFYSRNEGKLGVIDYAVNKIYIFNISGTIDFSLEKIVDCPNFAYDIGFDGYGQKVIISGFIADKQGIKKNKYFDLYSIKIRSNKVDYLLPSFEKYGLRSEAEYLKYYFTTQELPAIGIKAFMDVCGDSLYFVWEGDMRIIKYDLNSNNLKVFPKPKKSNLYINPKSSSQAARAAKLFVEKRFKEVWKEQEAFTYVRDIFATPQHVFVVYELGVGNRQKSKFLMQMYTPQGDYINELFIPGQPNQPMWFDKSGYELYAFSANDSDARQFKILKYELKNLWK